MALMAKIRARAGILIIAIGVAMVAFVAQDLLQGIGVFRGPSELGEIYGEDVDAMEFSELYQKYLEYQGNPGEAATRQQLYQYAWDDFVRRKM